MRSAISFYEEKRWNNWISRLKEMNLKEISEEELSSFLINMMDDVVVTLLKVLRSFEKGILKKEDTKKILESIRGIVLKPVELGDELKEMHIQSIQNALLAVFLSFERFIEGDEIHESVDELLKEAVRAEREGDYERALEAVGKIGVRVLKGDRLKDSVFEELPDGLILEWLDGIDSIAAAMTLDVEVETEEDEEEEEF